MQQSLFYNKLLTEAIRVYKMMKVFAVGSVYRINHIAFSLLTNAERVGPP